MGRILIIVAATLLIAASASAAPCGVGPERWQPAGARTAVLVGIDDYPGDDIDLSGAVADMDALCAILRDGFAFPSRSILRLTDGAATHDAIVGALGALAEGDREGHSLVFAFAGHGAQTEDEPGGDEAAEDQLDEVLCPADRDVAGDILDDDLFVYGERVLKTGAHLVEIVDACHSGTVGRTHKGDPYADATAFRQIDRVVHPAPTRKRVDSRGEASAGSAGREARVIRLSGAASSQVAGEGPDGAGKTRGYFSMALQRALQRAAGMRANGSDVPWSSLWPSVLEAVPEPQRPHVFGNLRRAVFGTADVASEPSATVTPNHLRPDSVELDWGLVAGLRKDSVVALYAAGSTLSGPDGFKGRFVVSDAKPFLARAKRISSGADPEVGDAAVIVADGGTQTRGVYVAPDVPRRDELVAMLEEDLRFHVDPDGRVHSLVVRTEGGCVAIEGGPSPWPASVDADCVVRDPSGVERDRRPTPHTWFRVLLETLNWERFRSIHNPSRTADEVAVILERGRYADGAFQPAGEVPANFEGVYEVRAGDVLRLSYRLIGPAARYVTATYLSDDRTVLPLNPVSLAEPVRPGRTERLDDALLQVSGGGVDYIKLFVIEGRAFDPSPFIKSTEPTRALSLGAATPVFARAHLTRGGGFLDDEPPPPETWGSLELTIRIVE